MAGKTNHRGFGWIRRLPSKNFQASYRGPDLARHIAPNTFQAKADAEAWLAAEKALIDSGQWVSQEDRRTAEATREVTLGTYAEVFLAERTLKPRTRATTTSRCSRTS